MQFLFDHGDEFFQDDGSSRKTTVLRALVGRLPANMQASYQVAYRADGREEVHGVLQARDRHGRRYFNDWSETAAQRRILRWAQRVYREIQQDT